MRLFVLVGWSAFFCILAGGCSDGSSSKEVAEFEGEWDFVAVEQNGNVWAPDELKGQRWSITGDEITATVPGEPNNKMKFKLNASKSPKEMDIMPMYGALKGRVCPAIYTLESGRLRVCSSDPGDAKSPRPKAFTDAMIFEKIIR